MDIGSRYEANDATEKFSVESLIQRVEEYQRRDHMETVERLASEGSLLQKVVVECQRSWCATIELLDTTRQAVTRLQRALEHCENEYMLAERTRFAFWGLERDSTMRQNYSPSGWI
jgi:hypothetical protein